MTVPVRMARRYRALCLSIAAVLLAAGCSGAPDTDRLFASTTNSRAAIAAKALEVLGAAYRPGATGPQAFDDSGLTYYAYRGARVSLPRKTRAQLDSGKPIELAAAKPADLLFFRTADGRDHDRLMVGLYVQPGEMIMASSGSGGHSGVTLFDVDDEFWQQRLVGVVRLLP